MVLTSFGLGGLKESVVIKCFEQSLTHGMCSTSAAYSSSSDYNKHLVLMELTFQGGQTTGT